MTRPLRIVGRAVISLDELRGDPREVAGREAGEEPPREVERLLDRAPLVPLADEAPLDVVDEGQDAAVVV